MQAPAVLPVDGRGLARWNPRRSTDRWRLWHRWRCALVRIGVRADAGG
jgi:hypothetical protein